MGQAKHFENKVPGSAKEGKATGKKRHTRNQARRQQEKKGHCTMHCCGLG